MVEARDSRTHLSCPSTLPFTSAVRISMRVMDFSLPPAATLRAPATTWVRVIGETPFFPEQRSTSPRTKEPAQTSSSTGKIMGKKQQLRERRRLLDKHSRRNGESVRSCLSTKRRWTNFCNSVSWAMTSGRSQQRRHHRTHPREQLALLLCACH